MQIVIKFLRKKYGEDVKEILKMKTNVFKLLIITILSQRTRDENTRKAAENLFSKVSKPEEILLLSDKELQKLIKPSGMYKQKAKNIKKLCKILVEELKGKIPRKREDLLKLPGVGNKTADVVLCYGYGIPTIPIDTHCNRVPKRLGLVPQNAKLEEVKKLLEKIVPEKNRIIVNIGFVKFGKNICRPIKPYCHICHFKKFCNYYKCHT